MYHVLCELEPIDEHKRIRHFITLLICYILLAIKSTDR